MNSRRLLYHLAVRLSIAAPVQATSSLLAQQRPLLLVDPHHEMYCNARAKISLCHT